MKKGFIKNEELLEEKVSDTDYLDFSESIETLSGKIGVNKKSNIIGVVGSFGVGKSTLISKVKDIHLEKDEEWIHFDAWQFPERKELWEGLILETSRYQGKLQKILEEVAGEHKNDVKTLVNTLGDIPGLSVIKNLNHFVKTSPATRVFQLQDIFASLINDFKKDKVVFVLEDVDRSGEAGLFFLETLRQFLNCKTLTKKVTVLVAISNESYFSSLDVYLKCLDYVEFFNKKNETKLTDFITAVIETSNTTDKDILIDFFNYSFNKYEDLNMRKVKLIIRQANLDYVELERKGFQPNPLICIAVTASKYLKVNPRDRNSYFDSYIEQNIIFQGSLISRLIFISNRANLSYSNDYIVNYENKLQHSVDIKLTKRDKPENVVSYPSTPYKPGSYYNKEEEGMFFLPDFYFKNL